MIAQPPVGTLKRKLPFRLEIPMAIQVGGVREQERSVTAQSPPHPILQPRGQLETPAEGTLSPNRPTSGLLQRGLSFPPWLSSFTSGVP